ncbi:uncharacterized protein PG998_000013 [Apiospora kogelbergensis]|uniref:uncharacterized protein n=1 Tax=Apiospora kogelbergensis TaxID=1337665 RepID=UPI003131CCCF
MSASGSNNTTGGDGIEGPSSAPCLKRVRDETSPDDASFQAGSKPIKRPELLPPRWPIEAALVAKADKATKV